MLDNHFYADDTEICISFDSLSFDSSAQLLSAALNEVMDGSLKHWLDFWDGIQIWTYLNYMIKSVHWLPVQHRISFKSGLIVHKTVNAGQSQ